MRSRAIRKLQLGSGNNALKGWLNTDCQPVTDKVLRLDVTEEFPLEDRSFHYVFSEHHIEHMSYPEGLFMLNECFRVLIPGGSIRVATNDLQTLIGLHTVTKSDLQLRYIEFITDRFLPHLSIYSECFVINNAFRNWGHQFIYDRATLRLALEDAGFIEITYCLPGESDDVNLRGIECHGKEIGDEELNCFETMVLEAKRPG